MLLEFRPLMCPTDATKANAALYFSLFIPTKIDRGTEEKTYMFVISLLGILISNLIFLFFYAISKIMKVMN